jgi:mono/diheme cytochrome c family protein
MVAAVVLLFALAGCSKAPPAPADSDEPIPVVADAPTESDTPTTKAARVVDGKALYANHCAQCHGDKGDGEGPAAKFLLPRPRNFGEARFRVVNTMNLMPSDEDLLHVITRGMPGSAMFPFGHLRPEENKAIVAHVRQLTQTRLAERIARQQEIEVADAMPAAEKSLRPGEILRVPDLPASSAEAIARGKELYVKTGCVACHGTTGKGDGVQAQRNDDGMPTRPRDFTQGIFKGGREIKQLYARVALGMPGSPMPSSRELKPDQVGDLVYYMLSLSDPRVASKVEHKRAVLSVKRVDKISDGAWASAREIPIVLTPLWWRDDADADLRISAVHDGKEIAVRLSWKDATRNDEASRIGQFEDMAAIQLFRGEVEPFIGMGATDKRLDLWLWRASWQKPASDADSILDDYPFESPNYREFIKGKDKPPDFVTARAAGNPIVNADRKQSAANLIAGGFGSTTFRPMVSQQVKANSTYKDGKWSVILRRPLEVGKSDGVSLRAKESCSIAFALWDGQVRDRNGQKLISIWHDLKLE